MTVCKSACMRSVLGNACVDFTYYFKVHKYMSHENKGIYSNHK